MNETSPNTAISYAAWYISRKRDTDHERLLKRSLRDFPMSSDDSSSRSQTLEIACEILALRGYIVIEKGAQSRRYFATDSLHQPPKCKPGHSTINATPFRSRSAAKAMPFMAVAAMTAACSFLPPQTNQDVHQEPPKFRKLTLIEQLQPPVSQYMEQSHQTQRPTTWVRLGGETGSTLETIKPRVVATPTPAPVPVIHLGQIAAAEAAVPQQNVPVVERPVVAEVPIAKKTPYIDGPNYFANAVPVIQPKVIASPLKPVPALNAVPLPELAKEQVSQEKPSDKPASAQTVVEPGKHQESAKAIATAVANGGMDEAVEAAAAAAAKAIIDSPPAAGKADEAGAPAAPNVRAQTTEPVVKSAAPTAEQEHVADQFELTDKDQIEAFLKQWAKDWIAKDVNATFAHYAKSFVPDGMSRLEWEVWRRKALARDGNIELTYVIRNVDVKGDRAMVLIWQSYLSPYFKSRIGKEFVLSKQDGNWLIHREIVRESARLHHA